MTEENQNEIYVPTATEIAAFEEDLDLLFDRLLELPARGVCSLDDVGRFFPADVVARCENPES